MEAIQVRITSALDVVKKAEQELATKKANNDPAATITAAEAKVAQAKTAQEKEAAALAAQKTKIADVGTQIAAAETASKVADAKVQQTIAAVLKTNKTVSPLHKAFTTIETNLKDVQARLASSQAELVEKKKAYEAVANKNPLKNAEIYAALKPRKSPQWTDLGAKPSGPDEVEIDVPAGIPAGIYTLRVGIRSTSGNAPPFFADQWITVAGNNDAGIGSFTKRGRTAFLLGETFWLAVAATSDQKSLPAGTKVEAFLRDADNARKPLKILDDAIPAEAGKRHTFLVNLDGKTTVSFAPGKYLVECRLGGRPGPPLAIDLIDPEPKTHFKNLLLGKYNNLGFDYSGLLGSANAVSDRNRWHYGLHKFSSASARDVVRSMVDSGYNAFKGMCYGMGRVTFSNSKVIRTLVVERAALGPWEAFAPPSGRDSFLDEAVRHGLEFYENLFTQHDSMMPRGEKFLQACERYSTLEATSMMHSPAFRGVCLYDELTQSLDHDTAGVVMAHFRKSEEALFRQRSGFSSSEAMKELDTFTALPEGKREYAMAEKYREWPRHLSWQWEEFSRRMAGAAKEVMPSSRNFTLHHVNALPGMNLDRGDGGMTGKFRNLELVSAVGYKDMGGFGGMALTGPIMADAMRVRDDLTVMPMIYGLGTGLWGDSNVRDAFLTLSQKPDGLSFFQFESSPKTPKANDNFSGVKDIAGVITTRYGNLFLAAEKGYKKVAIYNSDVADMLSNRKPIGTTLLCEGLWASCLRAGYPADFLTDEQLVADKGGEYEVIFAPGWHFPEEVPPDVTAALQRLLDAGKIVAVERASKLPNLLKGIVRLDSDLDEIDDRLGGSFPKHLDFDNERWWDFTIKTKELIREFMVKQKIPPAAEHDMLVGPDWLRCRKGEYLVVTNHASAEFTGNHKTMYQAPSRTILRFPARPPVCYDMLEMKRVEVKTLPDGKMELDADLRSSPGKIYAFLPAAIEKLSLKAKAPDAGGGDLVFEISALDAQGNLIDAGIPFEYEIRDANERILRHVYRTADPTYRQVYRVPVNLPAGKLSFRARELISGTTVEAEFSIGAGDFALPATKTPNLRIMQAARIRDFIDRDCLTVKRHIEAKDFKNARMLALRIRRTDGTRKTEHGHVLPDILSPHIFSLFPEEARKMIADYKATEPFTDEHVSSLSEGLNAVLDGDRLYTPEFFPPGILSVSADAFAQVKSKGPDFSDVNRLLLEQFYPGELYEGPTIFVGIRQDEFKGAAEKLRSYFSEKALRVRVTPMRPWMRGPTVGWGPQDKDLPMLDGMRMWRGEIVEPGVFVNGPLVLLGHQQDLVQKLVARDALPEPVSENFPGRDRCVAGWIRMAFNNSFNTIYALGDSKAVSETVDLLLEGTVDTVLARANIDKVKMPQVDALKPYEGKEKNPASTRADLSSEDHVRTIEIDPVSKRIAVGTIGYGHNLFCLDKSGELIWKQFLPEHNVYHLEWFDDGKKILAATGHGFFVFILDASNGKVLKKFAATEWPNMHGDREHNTEVEIVHNPVFRQFIILGATGLVAIDYDGNLMWKYERARVIVDFPPQLEQGAFAAFGNYLKTLDVVASPDGTKLAYNEKRVIGTTMGFGGPMALWANEPQILDAKTGKLLLRTRKKEGTGEEWKVTWPSGSEFPWIHASNLSAPLEFDSASTDQPNPGKLGTFVPPIKASIKIGGVLNTDFFLVERRNSKGQRLWLHGSEKKDNVWIRERDTLNDAQTRLWRSGRSGGILCLDLTTGDEVWSDNLDQGSVLALDGDELVAGARNGEVVRFNASGGKLWSKSLRDFHELPSGDYGEYLAEALDRDPDSTIDFFPVKIAREDDFKDMLKFGINNLYNGGFANVSGWKSEVALAADPTAFNGQPALKLAKGQLVTQQTEAKAVAQATYLLEFWYRPESSKGILAAGVMLHGDEGSESRFTGSNYRGKSGEWTFGRLAFKTMYDTKKIEVGFESEDGTAIAKTSLRVVRFPSANLLSNLELHKIEPTHPKDMRVRYDRIPQTLRERLLGQNKVTVMMQSTPLNQLIFTQSEAFLHNGRLDDVHEMWCFRPNAMGFSVTLGTPGWVSHVVLYMNNSRRDLKYRAISILANDLGNKHMQRLETGTTEIVVPRTVGFVRGDSRRFIVVKLDEPIFTDSVKVLPGHSAGRKDGVTEIEVYGPVGGKDQLAASGFVDDPNATAMFMSNPAHVRSTLPEDLVGSYQEDTKLGNHHRGERAPALHAGGTVVNDVFALPLASGDTKLPMPEGRHPIILAQAVKEATKKKMDAATAEARKNKKEPFTGWHSSTVTPLTTPARYAGRLIVGSADYNMHAVADNGAHLWAFSTEGRVYSSPTPVGRDVFFGSDDGRIYKIDIDSGILLWEFSTGGRVRSAPAVVGGRVYAVSWDGFLYALDANLGREIWKAPVAPETSASPAVYNNRIYLGDDLGGVHCFNTSNGQQVWKRELAGQRLSTCAVVTPDGIFLQGDEGMGALFNHSGVPLWQKDTFTPLRADGQPPPILTGQPVATKTQLFITTNRGLMVLVRATGARDGRFAGGPPVNRNLTSAIVSGNRLCVVENHIDIQGGLDNYIIKHGVKLSVWRNPAAK